MIRLWITQSDVGLQEKLSKTNSDYKAKIKTLQEELSTMETVQKDFVKLSQTLQVVLCVNYKNTLFIFIIIIQIELV